MFWVSEKDPRRNLRKHPGNHQGVLPPRIARLVSACIGYHWIVHINLTSENLPPLYHPQTAHTCSIRASGLQNQPSQMPLDCRESPSENDLFSLYLDDQPSSTKITAVAHLACRNRLCAFLRRLGEVFLHAMDVHLSRTKIYSNESV